MEDPGTETLEMVLSEVSIPFAKEYMAKRRKQRMPEMLGIHRVYVCVQVDSRPGNLFASYAVVERKTGWELIKCFHVQNWVL